MRKLWGIKQIKSSGYWWISCGVLEGVIRKKVKNKLFQIFKDIYVTIELSEDYVYLFPSKESSSKNKNKNVENSVQLTYYAMPLKY